MSVTEILQEIDRLPPEAILKIEAAIQKRRNSLVQSKSPELRPGFDALVRRVFDEHRDTMARLAQ